MDRLDDEEVAAVEVDGIAESLRGLSGEEQWRRAHFRSLPVAHAVVERLKMMGERPTVPRERREKLAKELCSDFDWRALQRAAAFRPRLRVARPGAARRVQPRARARRAARRGATRAGPSDSDGEPEPAGLASPHGRRRRTAGGRP
jgi:hypothetical protein